MNNIIDKFLLAGHKFIPEMHLRQPRFVYSACGPFTRHKEINLLLTNLIKEKYIRNLKIIYEE